MQLATLVAASVASPSTNRTIACTHKSCFAAFNSQVRQLNALHGGRAFPVETAHEKTLSDTAGSNWWSLPDMPGAYHIGRLDNQLYPLSYFIDIQGHSSPHYLPIALELTGRVLGRQIASVLELGNGGGYYTEKLLQKGYDVTAIEGTAGGVDATMKRGVPTSRVLRHDLRLPLVLARRFDMAFLTEVVEHVEPPFSSQLISTAVLHSDIIWFSGASDRFMIKGPASANHPNEKPTKHWVNLFDFYGFDCVEVPLKVRKWAKRGDMIAFNRSNPQLRRMTSDGLDMASKPEWKSWMMGWMNEQGVKLNKKNGVPIDKDGKEIKHRSKSAKGPVG